MRYVLAMDIGGTKIASALIPLEGDGGAAGGAAGGTSSTGSGAPQVLAKAEVATQAMEGGAAVLARVVALALSQLEAALGLPGGGEVVAIGVGSAGVVDTASGTITSATGTMPGWGGTELGRALREATGLPVTVIGDVGAHALGEHVFGAGRGYPSTLVMGLGTGIGGALVEGSTVQVGAHNVAGHIGHVHHALAAGRDCSCGRQGHLEPIASGSGIAAEYARLSGREATGREVDDLAEAGDAVALQVVRTAGRATGESLGSLANILDPGVIVLSGSVVNSGRTWWNAVEAGWKDQAMDPVAGTPLVRGELGSKAPLLGAAVATGLLD
ncbi:ROK family protein [Buchananella felis]|uniref:ROK family protein n=1 Tax=Buchananella felis TaxID=3231492 RepID=UPI003527B01B